ncbi:MAG: hypothetical protein HOV68_18245, partial [Streptomycetaceae bacterium]|nr:hypothetical protein [Streptomycetaceae bacterium]
MAPDAIGASTAPTRRPLTRVRRWLRRELPDRHRTFAAVPLAAGLAAVGGLHVAWGTGTTWPYATQGEFARHLVGRGDTAPPAFASYGGGVGLLAGAYLARGV